MSVNVGSVNATFQMDTSGLNQGLSSASSAIQNFGVQNSSGVQALCKGFESIGSTLTKTVTPAVTGAAAYVAKSYATFEESMSKVQALSGATGEEFQALEDMARKMGETTQFSASECADALGYMALAGWDTQEMIDGLPGVLDLAAAAQMDLAQASDIVTDYLSAFSLGASDAAHVSDLMAYAQANSHLSVEQLADGFKNCAANANAYGYTIEETTGVLAMFANQGLKGGEAGTAFNAILRDMTTQMEDGCIKIGETSVAIVDAYGNFRDMSDIVNDVSAATDGMSESEKANALQTTFTADSIKGMNLLLAAGGDELANFTGQLGECDGAAKDMASTMNDNAKGDLKQLGSAIEGAAISIGKIFAPTVRDIIQKITDLVRKFNGLDDGTKKTIAAFAGVAAAAGPVLLGIGKLGPSVVGLVGKFSGLLSGTMSLSGAFPALGSALSVLTGPVGIVIAAVAALALAFATNFGGIRDKVSEIISVFTDTFGPIISDLLNAMGLDFDGMGNTVKEVFNAVEEVVSTVLDVITSVITTVLDTIKSIWDNNFMGIRTIAEGVFEAIGIVIDTAMNAIKDVIDIVMSVIKGDWKGAWEGIKNLFSDIVNGIVDLALSWISTLLNAIYQLGSDLWSAAKTAFNNIWEAAKNIWDSLISWFKGAINDPVGTVLNIGSSLYDAGASIFNSLWDGLSGVWDSICSWVSDKVSWLADKLTFWNNGKAEMDGNWKGTNWATRGWHMIAEQGPELLQDKNGNLKLITAPQPVFLEGGEKVYTAMETAKLMKSYSTNATAMKDQLKALASQNIQSFSDSNMGSKLKYFQGQDNIEEIIKQALSSIKIEKGSNGGVNLNITNFYNNRTEDIKQLVNELEYYFSNGR